MPVTDSLNDLRVDLADYFAKTSFEVRPDGKTPEPALGEVYHPSAGPSASPSVPPQLKPTHASFP